MIITRNIELFERRCGDCGRYWAGERQYCGSCPYCIDRQRERAQAEVRRLTRANAALRGARKRAAKVGGAA